MTYINYWSSYSAHSLVLVFMDDFHHPTLINLVNPTGGFCWNISLLVPCLAFHRHRVALANTVWIPAAWTWSTSLAPTQPLWEPWVSPSLPRCFLPVKNASHLCINERQSTFSHRTNAYSIVICRYKIEISPQYINIAIV